MGEEMNAGENSFYANCIPKHCKLSALLSTLGQAPMHE